LDAPTSTVTATFNNEIINGKNGSQKICPKKNGHLTSKIAKDSPGTKAEVPALDTTGLLT
jgi:hypothetical protein